MAMVEKVLGGNIYVFDGSTLIACARSITISSSRKELDISCSGSGDIEQKKLGRQTITWDIELLDRYADTTGDDSTNISTWDFMDKYENKTQLTISVKDNGTLTAGEETYTGIGYITKIDLKATDDNAETFTASGFFNSFSKTRVAYA